MKNFVYLLCLFYLSACGSSSTSVGNGSYSVSGKVKSADNSALAGATVTFTGTSSGTATTASDGTYSFTGVNNGIYQITAAKTGYVVTPAALSLTVTNANVTGKDFTANPASYAIAGTISVGGAALPGVSVTLPGTSVGAVTTDASGNYSLSVTAGTYTVAPLLAGYVFTPTSLSTTVDNANVTGKNFTATPASYTISGTITSGGVALSGATVALSGTGTATTTTDTSGNYNLSVTSGTYTVVPSLAGYVFTPANLSATVANANVTSKNFTATPASHTISGAITSGGVALSGATVALSGAGTATTTTDTSGNYSFSVTVGSYTITPTKTTYIFTPPSLSATLNTADVTGKSFTAVYSSTGGGTVGPAALGAWTWISGDSNVNRSGTYGSKGVVAPTNSPGARGGAMSWTDNSGNLWLFGGSGIDATGVTGYLNDLWKFDGTNWTWISGGSLANRSGVYGTKGVPTALNEPSARDCGSTWSDSYGNLWLFGGIGLDRNGVNGYLDDLWKFDGTRWTWISGDGTANSLAVYGTKGVPSPTNKPGGREASVSWIGQNGRLWLFGGSGKDAAGAAGHLNEIWQFDGTNWTWVSGTTIANDGPSYGTMGIPSSSNRPWGRDITKTWVDPDGNLWLFGGCSNNGYLSDLWKFDGTNWTWVSGNNTFNTLGLYSITGIPSATARPGGRAGAIFWMDSNGSLWIQGGYGTDGGYNGEMNDLWKFDGTNWTVIAGNGTSNQTPVYGTKGVASALNTPARVFGSASWVKGGQAWAFGGYVPGGMTNVLWKYEP